MRHVAVSALIPGMITGEDVCTYSDQLLVSKGFEITPNVIDLLHTHHINAIKVADSPAEAAALPPTYYDRIKSSPEFRKFAQKYTEHTERFETAINEVVRKNSPLNIDWLLSETLSLLIQDGVKINAFDMLMNIRDLDDCTYSHCINSALLCHLFAEWMDFSEEEKETATLCGMFFDIGKMNIPPSILEKRETLSAVEYPIIRQHAEEGYDILTKLNLPEHICNAALMHHEKCDGSGYPKGLRGSQIDRYAKLVTIVDIYDAMTSARTYRGPICPFDVIAAFEKEGFQKYDTRYILIFLEKVASSFINQEVRLNDGTIGTIVFLNKASLARPIIKTPTAFLDLSRQKELFIEELL